MSKQIKEISVTAMYDNQGKIEGFVSYDEKLRVPVFYSSSLATVIEIKSLLSKMCDEEVGDTVTRKGFVSDLEKNVSEGFVLHGIATQSVDPNKVVDVDNRIPLNNER